MISIVVCSVKEEMFNEFSASVESTIGTAFEIIRIDNRKNQYNICEAYNKGKEMCRYDIIVFCHEDILFETTNWGNKLIEIFKDPAIGLVGVLGICYLSLFPNDWLAVEETEGQLIVGALKDKPTNRHVRFPGNQIAEVVGADGMFLSSTKAIMNKFRFSEDILKGFHGYDIDISFQIRKFYKIVVTRDILFYHHSGGAYNASYYEAMKLLSKKWKHSLPAYVPFYKPEEIRNLKIKSLEAFCQRARGKKMFILFNLKALIYAANHGVLFTWVNKKISNRSKRIFYRRTAMQSQTN